MQVSRSAEKTSVEMNLTLETPCCLWHLPVQLGSIQVNNGAADTNRDRKIQENISGGVSERTTPTK